MLKRMMTRLGDILLNMAFREWNDKEGKIR
jgi:hypothetical protein